MRFILSLVFFVVGVGLTAQKYSRLADLNDNYLVDRMFISSELGSYNGAFYFMQYTGANRYLVKTDGSLTGTTIVTDLASKFNGTQPTTLNPVVYKDHLYFTINDYLYRLDNLENVEAVLNQNGQHIISKGLNKFKDDIIYLYGKSILAFNGEEERELVANLPNDPSRNYPSGIGIGNGRIPVTENFFYFEFEIKMYRSDGTEEGLEELFTGVSHIYNHESSALSTIHCDDGIMACTYQKANFVYSKDQSFEIYHRCSQGNPNCHQTPSVKSIIDSAIFATYMGDLYHSVNRQVYKLNSYGGGSVLKFAGHIFFAGDDYGGYGNNYRSDIWYSSAEPGSEKRLIKTNPLGSGNPVLYVASGNVLYYSALDENGRNLYKATRIADEFAVEKVFAFSDLGISSIFNPVMMEDNLLFNAGVTKASGKEVLAFSDGTTAGSKLLSTDEIKEESSFPDNFTLMGEDVWFEAKDSKQLRGLYKVPTNSMAVEEIKYDNEIIVLGNLKFQPVNLNDNWYFLAYDKDRKIRLWVHNGVTTEPVSLAGNWLDYPVGLFSADGQLYVIGEKLVKVINGNVVEVGQYSLTNPEQFVPPTEFYGANYFFAETTEGWGLCTFTPGEEVRVIKYFNPLETNAGNPLFTPFNYELFFVGGTSEFGEELWKTDGTEQGTTRVTDLNEGSENGNIKEIEQGSAHQLFFVAKILGGGDRMFYTNGSAETTFPVTLGSSSEELEIDNLTRFNNKVYFSIKKNGGRKIWYTNGIPNGTDYLAFHDSHNAHESLLTVRNGKLWFIESDRDITANQEGSFGSRGTKIGEINKYISDSRNHLITDDRIYYAGYDAFGWEPHATKYCFYDFNITVTEQDEFLQAPYGMGAYQWIDCNTGVEIENATTYKFYPAYAGDFQCKLIANTCELYTDCVSFGSTTTSVTENNKEFNIVVYPNPSSDGVFSISGIEKNEPWQLYNTMGKLIQSGSGVMVDISKSDKGIYILKVDTRLTKLMHN